MGNILRSNTEEDYILQLITLSNDTISSETIYDIMMKTGYLASELIGIYKRFIELDIEKRGKISNQEFLSMGELRYNPFRGRLKISLPMRSEDYIKNITNFISNKDEDSFEKITLAPQNASSKIAPEFEDTTEIDMIPYIDFSQFCQYLGVFSPRATNDVKFNFLFKIFDIDEDGLLNKVDFQVSLKSLLAGNMNPEEIDEAIDHIFRENSREEEKYLTKEEFQKSLWMTDFYQKISLYFTN
ncbi:hypothetical protein SteCoe_28061 [Stentor coeruleus]|uniref:EF-hand domain-containing protein n=1 Tax=Stentor coeruleus TaxID=5963 RepID=A0A1R2B941_9CILI|nr:hypothetical protein SteCoe_28061 [Stentor coeruleus]